MAEEAAGAGKEELRHGIVLTKSVEAKRYGIKTAEALWQARKKCSDLVVLPPRYGLYKRYSSLARAIYYDYTDQVEPFGLDEAWLDVTGSLGLLRREPAAIAHEIRERVKRELGCTVSVGVSWNKIYAKFGSDYRKPDAVTVISRTNYRDVVWGSPVRDLLYVGPATERKLRASAIETIGDLAHASDEYLRRRLGKMGFVLRTFARGEDATPVKRLDPERRDVIREVKSYGNGLTAPHPITSADDAKALVWLLSESVAQRMKEDGVQARTVSIGVRSDVDLSGYGCQAKLPRPTAATRHVARAAWAMLAARQRFGEGSPIYIPTPCQRCSDAPCMKAAKDGAMYRRDDGMPIIDPEKSKGQKRIVDACPYGAVFWNEELEIPQKCTGCAHLLDGADPMISVPRCFDNCPTGAIQYGEEGELDLEGAELLHPESDTAPHVWYKGLPKKFVAGIVYDPYEKEIVEGAKCTLSGPSGSFTAMTDDMGDFWLRDLPEDDWTLTIEGLGRTKVIEVSTKTEDIGLGDIALA